MFGAKPTVDIYTFTSIYIYSHHKCVFPGRHSWNC